jgi:hypothetical protein
MRPAAPTLSENIVYKEWFRRQNDHDAEQEQKLDRAGNSHHRFAAEK